ncbi:MAG: phage tail tape measure protein [Acidovorax sp.]|jgi:lambda family phage tail tape measure protein|nr:phage tail tape measure protein [Acidovorax sp.]
MSGAVNYLKFLLTADGKQLRDEVEKSRKSVSGFVDGAKSKLVGLAGAAVGLVSIGAILGKVRAETLQAEREQTLLGAALKATGNQAGYSQGRLNDMASAMEGLTTITAGEFNQAQTVLLGFTNIVGNQVPKALMAAADYSTRTGADMKAAAEVIGRALDVPSAGMSSLQKQGFKFSESQIEAARQLERTGRVAEAQQIVLDALNETYGGAAVAARDTFGGALKGLQNQINSLLTGDAGSFSEAKKSVNGLTDLLSSPETKKSFEVFVGWLATVATSLAELSLEFVRGLQYSDGFFDALVKYGLSNPFKSPAEHLAALRGDLEKVHKLESTGLAWMVGGEESLAKKKRGIQQQINYWEDTVASKEPRKPKVLPPELTQPDMTPRTVGSVDLKDLSGAKAQQAQRAAYDSLIASIRTKREQVRQELQDDEKLTDSQKMRIKLDQDLAQGKLKLSASNLAAVRAELDLLAVEEKRMEARKGKKLTDELLSANAPLAADFADKWKLLSAAYDGTEAGMERLIKAQAVLLAQQPFAQQAAALKQARAEAEQYLAVMERAQAREVATVGMGGRRGEYVAGLNQIEDAYAGRRYDLGRDQQQARVRNGGTLSAELEAYYQQQFALIDEFERKAKSSYERTFQAIGEAQANWVNGAQRAFDDYAASAANVAEQTAGLFSRAFSGMEDSLVSFAMTGKADFKSMAESIIADLIRIQIRASMVQILGGASGGLFGALVSGVSSFFGSGSSASTASSNYSLTTASNYNGGGLGMTYGGGRERGGSVAAGTMYEVNEGGVPELLNIGQQQFLMMGQQSGSVVPLGNFGGGSMPAGGAWQAGAPIDIDLQIINQGRPAQAEATVERQPDGRAMVKVILREVAADIAGGGEVARGIKQRFSVKET